LSAFGRCFICSSQKPPLEALEWLPMASGNRAILLTRKVAWESFEEFVGLLVKHLGARVIGGGMTSVEGIWEIEIDGQRFWLVCDDWLDGPTLEPCDSDANSIVEKVYARLVEIRSP